MLWSIVIPVLNEAGRLRACLESLQQFRSQAEIIVVDGHSTDQSLLDIEPLCDQVLASLPGRARQMNQGASIASGDWLLFLHADTRLPDLPTGVSPQLDHPAKHYLWGFFPVAMSNKATRFRVIAWFMNRRSTLTGVATGDQALYVKHDTYRELSGYADVLLMEDVEICKRLRQLSPPLIQPVEVISSARRWEQHGFIRTIFTMWGLRLAYVLGVSPKRLARIYYG
ncbi:MAG: rSAM/selenodomain-associated transferase 2 [Halieaceae bacterium]|jgi:rSAM/selenodomain-associated transferase 2